MPRDWPRGRIFYEGGFFHIRIGEDCPISPIKMLKNTFGLMRIDDSKFRIKRDRHWNTKSIDSGMKRD